MGRRLTLADAIDNRQEARWVAAQLEKLAGLKLDTHVAVKLVSARYGPPPQRGRAPSGSSSAFRRNSPAAIAVGLAFFLAWMGFVGYRFFSRGHRQTNRVSKVGAPAKSSPAPGSLLAAHRHGSAASANAPRAGAGRRIAGAGDSARSPRTRFVRAEYWHLSQPHSAPRT